MSPASDDRLFRISFETVECFSILLVVAYWILPFTGSIWGTKLRSQALFDASVPVMIVVLASVLLTWRRYRKHALVQIAVLLAWAVWSLLPEV